MKLAIVGSRNFCKYPLLQEILNPHLPNIQEVVSGGAKGADSLGARWAKEHNIPLTEILPEWDKYGKSAGFIRNKLIIDQCDLCIAFWDGKSKGTQHSINLAKKAKKPIIIVEY